MQGENARTGISGDSSVVANPWGEFLGTGVRYRLDRLKILGDKGIQERDEKKKTREEEDIEEEEDLRPVTPLGTTTITAKQISSWIETCHFCCHKYVLLLMLTPSVQ